MKTKLLLYSKKQKTETEKPSKRLVSKKEEIADKYGWYNWIYTCAKGEYLNIKEVVKTPVKEFLFFINYQIEYNEAEDEEIKKKNKG